MIVVSIKARRQAGISIVELLASLAIAALLLAGIQQLIAAGMATRDELEAQTELNREARFAMARMVAAVRETNRLLLPLADNPGTDWDENIRVQTVPASPAQGSSLLASAVLAVTVSQTQDLDADGIADIDNDGDGRIDEDPSGDVNNDLAPGIFSIDDDGDGIIDEQHTQAWNGKMGPLNEDDDEDDFANKNP